MTTEVPAGSGDLGCQTFVRFAAASVGRPSGGIPRLAMDRASDVTFVLVSN